MAERDSSEMDYEEIIATKFTKKWLNIYYPTVSANYFQICQIFISSLMVCSLAQEKIVSSLSVAPGLANLQVELSGYIYLYYGVARNVNHVLRRLA